MGNKKKDMWRDLQPHPGTQVHNYRCSLPGLAGFVIYCCGGTGGHHNEKAKHTFNCFTASKARALS